MYSQAFLFLNVFIGCFCRCEAVRGGSLFVFFVFLEIAKSQAYEENTISENILNAVRIFV